MKNYDFEGGGIFVNGIHDLKDVSTYSWRRLVAIVPQQIHIYNATVLENIAFDEATSKTQDVLTFLNEYGFMGFMESLPQSFMTLVGEEGVSLSGGQKQIIALARALYSKPELIIFDEATSAMDRTSEHFVLNLLMRLKNDIGIIFITHRLNILRSFCDKIYILQNGETANFGTHDQLLTTDNLYRAYWSELLA
jgi:ABC-type multidrug transport system fused ATPase/permease subunit